MGRGGEWGTQNIVIIIVGRFDRNIVSISHKRSIFGWWGRKSSVEAHFARRRKGVDEGVISGVHPSGNALSRSFAWEVVRLLVQIGLFAHLEYFGVATDIVEIFHCTYPFVQLPEEKVFANGRVHNHHAAQLVRGKMEEGGGYFSFAKIVVDETDRGGA